jgi:hypothetical protein
LVGTFLAEGIPFWNVELNFRHRLVPLSESPHVEKGKDMAGAEFAKLRRGGANLSTRTAGPALAHELLVAGAHLLDLLLREWLRPARRNLYTTPIVQKEKRKRQSQRKTKLGD